MMLPVLLLFVSLSLSLTTQGTPPLSGSENVPDSDQAAIQKVDSLNEAAFHLKNKSIDSAFSLLKIASVLAKKHDYKRGLANNFLYEAGIYKQYGHTRRALALYYKALDFSGQAGDSLTIARANQQISKILVESGNLKEAEKLLREAKKCYSRLGIPMDHVNVTNDLGLLKLKQDDLAAAERYFKMALQMSKANDYWYGEKKANFHLGIVFLKANDLAVSKAYFTKALHMDEQRLDRYGLSLAQNKLAEIAIRENKFEQAISLTTLARENAQSISASVLEREAINSMIEAYKSDKNYFEVVKWQEKLIERQSQIFTEERDQALVLLDILKKKDEEQLAFEQQTLENQQKTDQIQVVLILVIVGLSILAFFAFMWLKNYRKARQFNAILIAKNKEIQKNGIVLKELNHTISEQNESLEANNLMKDKLFSIVSHDLRSPLASLKGFINLMQRKAMTPEDTNRILNLLNIEVDTVLNMLGNLLDWSKTQLSDAKVTMEPVDLHEIAEENIKLVSTQASKKGISIWNNLPVDATALGDRERLNFVVRNLLMNAIKFTYEGGKIELNAEENLNNMILSVTDDGKGMTAESMSKLFKGGKGFTTLVTEKEKGTGLGLNLSNDFIQSIGGSIKVESELNQGSTFYILLQKQHVAHSREEVLKLA